MYTKDTHLISVADKGLTRAMVGAILTREAKCCALTHGVTSSFLFQLDANTACIWASRLCNLVSSCTGNFLCEFSQRESAQGALHFSHHAKSVTLHLISRNEMHGAVSCDLRGQLSLSGDGLVQYQCATWLLFSCANRPETSFTPGFSSNHLGADKCLLSRDGQCNSDACRGGMRFESKKNNIFFGADRTTVRRKVGFSGQ